MFRINEYFIKYFDRQLLSLPALFNAIQHHTGLQIKFDIRDNTKFSNKDLNNHEFVDDSIIEIIPKTKLYSYRHFQINKGVETIMRNKYETLYEPICHKVYKI
jgi:hypothetical protein